MYDVVIVGAGINGSMLAYELSKKNIKVLVLESRSDAGLEQTMSNSAIIHSGIDPKDNTLKKKFNLEGAKLMKKLCFDLDIEYSETGAIICAMNEEEDLHLKHLIEVAKERNIKYTYLLKDEIKRYEKNISNEVISGLLLPTTAIVYPFEITTRLIQIAKLNDVKVLFDTKVVDIKDKISDMGYYEIKTLSEKFKTKIVINACGNQANVVANYIQKENDFKIIHKRGEYFVTDNDFALSNTILYPVPSKVGKGVLVVPTVHGNYLLGPNSKEQKDSDDSTHKMDLEFVKSQVTKLVNKFPDKKIIKRFSGVRSSSSIEDFHIKVASESKNFLNIACIDSPGLSSSPAIAKYAIELIGNMIKLTDKANHIKKETTKLSLNETKIICKCERVSVSDIKNSVRGINGSRSLVGTRFRSRATAGICQGSRCEAMTIKIMAEELNIPVTKIRRYDADTYIVGDENESI